MPIPYIWGVVGVVLVVSGFDWVFWGRMDRAMGFPPTPWRWRQRRVSPWLLMGGAGVAVVWSNGRFSDPPLWQAGLAVVAVIASQVWWMVCIYRDIRGD